MKEPFQNLSEEFEYNGLWWDAEKPEIKLTGTLFAKPSEVRLEVHSSDTVFGDTVESICGVVRGALVTLCDVVSSGESGTGGGLTSSTYDVRYVLSGIHATDKTLFTKARVLFSEIEYSAGSHLIGHETNENGFQFEIKTPINHEIKLSNFTLRTENWVQGTHSGFHATYDELFEFVLIPPVDSDLTWFVERAFDLRNLLTALHGRMAIFKKIILKTDDMTFIHLYFEQPHVRHKTSTMFFDIYLPIKVLGHDVFEIVCRKWFDEFANKMIAIRLFCRTFYHPNEHYQADLILQCQTLEAFHRAFFPGEYMTADEYRPYLEDMVGKIPPTLERPLRQRIESALKYGYQYSQKKRFSELMAMTPDFFKAELTKQPSLFLTKVLDTRNFYTHSDEFTKSNVILDEDVSIVNFGLASWFNILFLIKLGVPEATLLKRLDHNPALRLYNGFKGDLDFV